MSDITRIGRHGATVKCKMNGCNRRLDPLLDKRLATPGPDFRVWRSNGYCSDCRFEADQQRKRYADAMNVSEPKQ